MLILFVFAVLNLANKKKSIWNNNFYPIKIKETTDIPLNNLECYNFKTKDEIYEIRKKYVNSSIFANKKYRPSEEVFGQIVSNKPWRSLDNEACLSSENASEEERIQGISEESRYINNPHILIGVEKGFVYSTKEYYFCNDQLRFFLPYKTTYDYATNTIISYYKINPDYSPETLNGKNARDLGYQYAYASDYDGIFFTDQNSVSTVPYKFKDFIHLGGSCGVNGGCNNGSPGQPELSFNITSFPAYMTFKLWHDEPNSKDSTPDIYYKIIFITPDRNP